jgi:hypothetical protein
MHSTSAFLLTAWYGALLRVAGMCGVLQFQLLRDITGEQFAEAVNKRLQPRMQITGELHPGCGAKGACPAKQLSNCRRHLLPHSPPDTAAAASKAATPSQRKWSL